MRRIDFYDLNGNHVDQCEPWQLGAVLPVLQVLFGAVTQVETEAAPMVVTKSNLMDDFIAWIEAGCPQSDVVVV